MAAVYKSLSRTGGDKKRGEGAAGGVRKNKQRVLILSSRGVTYRHRHLLNDIHSLLPHSRKDAKLDTKTKLYQLNELADLYNCNNILFFEARKAKDLYLWISKPPNGPTIKLHLQNLHTMEELHFPGNCLKGSRPILSFDEGFEAEPHWRLLREMLAQAFGVPKGARGSKPFIDRVMGFSIADGRVWVRCYQINETEPGKENNNNDKPSALHPMDPTETGGTRDLTNLSLTELGPRFVMIPILVQESSFGGPIIYQNKEFVSPNVLRTEERLRKAGRYRRRVEEGVERTVRRGEMGFGKGLEGELDDGSLFA
ncbi:MAG: Ribosome biogenesis protein brx1 [Trichoglossum hirsutum]|nr:MAG: Ribosome biogenesis protein brx1 [Trichoglossum hirsutum]